MPDFDRTMPWGTALAKRRLYSVHLDAVLLLGLLAIIAYGLLMLNSVAGSATLLNQLLRLGAALAIMVVVAQLDPRLYLRWAPALYVAGILLLAAVAVVGTVAKGSERWLDLPGLPRFQPSEIMKIAVPLVIAWYLHERTLPPRTRHVVIALVLVALPAGLIAAQPDLGTALMVAGGGLAVVFLAGIQWRWIAAAGALAAAAMPVAWFALYDYQRGRVLTFLDPERDPLGAGWNIVQSKTAIGSGGFLGKGIGDGTQSQLDFLPESSTDFIIAVIAEELGLVGVTVLLALYLVVITRALYLATRAPTTFGRLATGSLTLVFFAYVFVNIAMVCGMLPVVGVPLPLVSYGGTSAVTLLIGFGIVMSIHTHRGW